jgi:hypothetical protein
MAVRLKSVHLKTVILWMECGIDTALEYAGGDPACRADLAPENGRLRRENERLRMEREPVLKHFHGRMPMGCSCPRCNLPT